MYANKFISQYFGSRNINLNDKIIEHREKLTELQKIKNK